MVCLLPFKANTAKQSHGLGLGLGVGGWGGGARVGRQADSRPHPPTKAATNQTKRDGEHNTNSTMIGSGGSRSAVHCFSWSLVPIEEGRGDWGRGNYRDQEVDEEPTLKWTEPTESDWDWRGGEFSHGKHSSGGRRDGGTATISGQTFKEVEEEMEE